MNIHDALKLLPPEIVKCSRQSVPHPWPWVMLMIDEGTHAQVWLCERTKDNTLIAMRRVDVAPGRVGRSSVVPNSQVYRAAAKLYCERYHLRIDTGDFRVVGNLVGIAYANEIEDIDLLTLHVRDYGKAWEAAHRLGVVPRKIDEALNGES